MTATYEPTEEDRECLNRIEMGYVGLSRPRINFVKEDSCLIPLQQALEEDGDYLPIDLQGWE